MTNFDLEKIVDTNDEWIKSMTGIRERRIVSDGENVSDLAARAGLAALADAGLDGPEIDLVLVASGSPEMIWPSTACLAQAKMGLNGSAAFDIQAACAGFVYGLAIADSMISSGAYRHILLVGAEAMSRLVDWGDRNTCVLFGDGAGAVVLGPAGTGYGVIGNYLASDGAGADLLKIPAGGSGMQCDAASGQNSIKMRGHEVFKFAVKTLPIAIEKVLEKANLTIADIDYCVPHQANRRIIEAAVERLGLPLEKVVGNIEKYGNTSTASIPLALEELIHSGRLKPGDVIVTAGIGAGLTWGANVIRWGDRA